MKIGIVGAGASGLYLALLLKKENKSFEISIFDHCNKIGKKLSATGNGKGNLLNQCLSPESFNNPSFVTDVMDGLAISDLRETLKSMGILMYEDEGLYYPLSDNANNVVNILKDQLIDLGVEFKLEEDVLSYEGTKLKTTLGNYQFDKIVFAVGGKSQEKLGSNGSLLNEFKRHRYIVNNPVSGLCPIKVRENTKTISGLRHKAEVSALIEGKEVFKEKGEILFKDDGLSGIVIFNASRILKNQKNCIVKIDLFPGLSKKELSVALLDAINSGLGDKALLSFFRPEFVSFVEKRLNKKLNKENTTDFAELLKNIDFTYISNYGFDNSQVTLGGIDVSNLNKNLESKIEKNVYFIGEVVDVDGPCGGYNLGWCLISALAVSKAIK